MLCKNTDWLLHQWVKATQVYAQATGDHVLQESCNANLVFPIYTILQTIFTNRLIYKQISGA